MPKISKVYQVSEDEFITIIQSSPSCAVALQKLGYTSKTGGGYLIIKRRAAELGLDLSHWDDVSKQARLANLTPTEQYFAPHTTHSGIGMRTRILKEGLLPYKCAICGFEGEWNGKPLVLQIDHINGDHSDNRIENLRFICPNCHTQTETFAGRNVGRSKKE